MGGVQGSAVNLHREMCNDAVNRSGLGLGLGARQRDGEA